MLKSWEMGRVSHFLLRGDFTHLPMSCLASKHLGRHNVQMIAIIFITVLYITIVRISLDKLTFLVYFHNF